MSIAPLLPNSIVATELKKLRMRALQTFRRFWQNESFVGAVAAAGQRACKRHPMHIHVTVQPLFIICLPLPAARPPRLTPAPAWQQSKSAGVIAQGHHSPVTASLLHSCHADRASHSNLSVVQTRLGRLFVRVSLVDALIML